MNLRHVLLCAPLLLGAASCSSHQGSYAYPGSRKLLQSEAPFLVKLPVSPLALLPETLVTPIAFRRDAAREAELQPGHRYRSYEAVRALNRSDLGGGYLILGFLPVFVIDTVLLPITGLFDAGYALTHD